MTIAKQLKIKEFPFEINNSNGNQIYIENSGGYWIKREFDSKGNRIYWENSNGYWSKREFDSEGKEIYFEDSVGKIHDNRPKTDVEKALELLEKEGYQIFKYI